MERSARPGFFRALLSGAGEGAGLRGHLSGSLGRGLATGLALGLLAGWWAWPRLVNIRLTQPVRFSHTLHARQDVACATCHFTGPGGAFSGFPALSVCAGCHPAPTGGKGEDEKEIDKLVNTYVLTGRSVPWLSSQRQPGHVFFAHGPHLPLGCPACHPDMRRTDSPDIVRNAVSGSTLQAMSMARCRACHRESGAADECLACHR